MPAARNGPSAVAETVPGTPRVHRVELKVRFHELDPNGHLNHGVYLNLFETARIEIMERLGYPLARLHAQGVGLVVVEANVRFLRPALAGDVLVIDSHISELRRASGWWRQVMRRHDEVVAETEVRSTVVGATGRPTRPPPDLLAALELLRG